MKTQTLPVQSRLGTLVLPRILAPSSFSPTSDNPVSEKALDPAVESTVNRLVRHPFLAGMNPRHVALLASWAKIAQFKKGQVIFHEGDLADRFYLVESGKVGLESSSGLRDPRLGWSWMFPPHIRSYTARALEPVTTIFFYGPIVRQYCEKDHSFGYEFLKRMSLEMYRRQTTQNNIRSAQSQIGVLQPPEAVAA
jgi:CRP-like cAMP-binding protein